MSCIKSLTFCLFLCCYFPLLYLFKACPHCRRSAKLSPKSATVAEFGDCRRFLAVFGDSRRFRWQCGQGFRNEVTCRLISLSRLAYVNPALLYDKHFHKIFIPSLSVIRDGKLILLPLSLPLYQPGLTPATRINFQSKAFSITVHGTSCLELSVSSY